MANLGLWVAVASCCPAKPSPVPPAATASAATVATSSAAPSTSAPPPAPSATGGGEEAGVAARAAELVELASRVEPTVTPTLLELAENGGGEMVKLQFKLKTRASTERKVRAALARDTMLEPSTVRIDDALRYTMRVDDDPAGHYVDTVKATLAALETKGHVVEYVKNYWPADDNYSGVNAVLRHASGLLWELQFHTAASFAVQSETHDEYEELRSMKTSDARKRELFDAMTKRWNTVPIPQGALVQGALHAKDHIRERTRP